jgi:hypothetical protein
MCDEAKNLVVMTTGSRELAGPVRLVCFKGFDCYLTKVLNPIEIEKSRSAHPQWPNGDSLNQPC